jgi:hypothetical protein
VANRFSTADEELAYRGPNPEFEGIPRWEMQKGFPHFCIHCNEGYNNHWPWPDLPCQRFIRLREDKAKAESIIHMNS